MDGLILLLYSANRKMYQICMQTLQLLNIINMNESPICPDMVETKILCHRNSPWDHLKLKPKYKAASADYLSDDGK